MIETVQIFTTFRIGKVWYKGTTDTQEGILSETEFVLYKYGVVREGVEFRTAKLRAASVDFKANC